METSLDKVSAVLLTLGEATTSSALEALHQQTYPLADIIEVRNKSPFSSAFNYGLDLVKTPFFIQCDADMILDPNCLAELIQGMKENVAMVYGYLRDPLVGHICGIKLYRTEACKNFLHNNHFNCELMFVDELAKQGWQVINIDPTADTALGAHREDISDSTYLFERFRILGIKIQHRKDWWDLAHRLIMLSISGKMEAATATDGLICGFFIENQTEDQLVIEKKSPYYNLWKSIAIKRKRVSIKTLPTYLKKTFGINPFWAGYLTGTALRYLGNSKLYETPLQYQKSELITNWAFRFGHTAAMYRKINTNNNTDIAYKKIFPFFAYLEKQLSYHLQYAKHKMTVISR